MNSKNITLKSDTEHSTPNRTNQRLLYVSMNRLCGLVGFRINSETLNPFRHFGKTPWTEVRQPHRKASTYTVHLNTKNANIHQCLE